MFPRRPLLPLLLAGAYCAAWPGIGCAEGLPEQFAAHAQLTYVEQQSNAFHAPYAGANSLPADTGRQTADFTLYLGVRPWAGGELWLNPELDQGFGLGDTTGLAGFASGEAYKVGRKHPYLRWQRAFLRQTWSLGGEDGQNEAGANQFATTTTADRIVLTLGRFSAVDLFDVNRYAHDPRDDFLNWAVIDTGSLDYAADAWGYTVGAAVELWQGAWTLRAGLFDVSDVPNSTRLESGFDEYQTLLEAEHRHQLGGHAGKLAVTGFITHARMALLEDAIAWGRVTGLPPDPAAVRRPRDRAGIAINAEQELTADIGAFLRAGNSAGNVETYDFTDIDRTLVAGLSLSGARWGRRQDTVGVAGVLNHISAARQRYLAAGGLGVLVGDGRLPTARGEQIIEAYYRYAVAACCALSLDLQHIVGPGYNGGRGPVSLGALRLHLQL